MKDQYCDCEDFYNLQEKIKKAFEKTLEHPQGDYQKGYKQAMEDLKKEILGE